MFIKIFIILLLLSSTSYAALGRVVTQEQLDKLCVPIELAVDLDTHWFYYKSILSFTEDGISIVYGNNKINFIPKKDVLNFSTALIRYNDLKVSRP